MRKMPTALALAAGLCFLGCGKSDGPGGPGGPGGRGPGREKPPVPVEVMPVRQETVRDLGWFSGSLIPRVKFTVAPKVAGRLMKLTVNVGDEVKSGQLIALLDDDEYARQVDQAAAESKVAEASVAECRSAREVADLDLKRVKSLHDRRMVADSEFEAAQSRATAAAAKEKVALAEVDRRLAAQKAADVRLSYTRIKAEWEGPESRVVGERFVDEGEMLAPNKPIVSILDNTVQTAVVDVIERDYSKIALKQTALVTTDAWPGEDFGGHVIRIAPLLKETSRQARVEIEVPNPKNRLRPGMFVRARIEFAVHEKVTVAPLAAVTRREGQAGVFLIEGDKARFVPLKLGIAEGDVVEVVSPPLTGAVVTLGHHLLESGDSVILPGATPAPGEDKGRGGKGRGPAGPPGGRS